MEDALREQVSALFTKALTSVLILVLMEDALRVAWNKKAKKALLES